ncbi:MAG TPA: hypothetical protein VG454_12735 [Gemmatimonadales bacterium]|nr:hypothetical protein [Gemmatimonadales bacterium]
MAGIFVASACGPDLTGLLPAAVENRTDTVTVYAVSGTPVATPSGYIIVSRQVVRIDQNPQFDFAFDIDSSGRALIKSTGAMKLGQQSGVQITTTPFDSIQIAPTGGYQEDSAVVLNLNTVAILHSRAAQCNYDLQPSHHYFAKMHVTAIDTVARSIQFEVLTDVNCGYRGLEPGLPKH